MRLRRHALTLTLLCTACGGSGNDVPGTAPDTVTMLTPGGAVAVPPMEARHFDPGSLSIGDSVLGVRVVQKEVHRVFDDSVWSGTVAFAGEITVTGEYRPHFDYPEVDAHCFWITDSAAIARLPEFAPDTWTSPDEQTWFCFTNPIEARAALAGAPGDTVTIVIDDYVTRRIFTDAWDTARFVRLAP